MAYSLTPAAGESLWVNRWKWRPTIELLVRAGILSPERAERLHYNGGSGDVSAAEAGRIGQFLESFLASMTSGQRLLIDGAISGDPDTGELFGGPDWDKNYSATFEWLQKFRDFCKASGGFRVL